MLKLYGKVTAIRLGSEFVDNRERVDIKLEAENGSTPYFGAPPGVLTVINERSWRLGEACELELNITKIAGARPAARVATAAGKT